MVLGKPYVWRPVSHELSSASDYSLTASEVDRHVRLIASGIRNINPKFGCHTANAEGFLGVPTNIDPVFAQSRRRLTSKC